MIKTFTFWTGLLIFGVTAAGIFFPDDIKGLSLQLKSIIGGIVLVIYFINEHYKNKEVSNKERKSIIESLLARVGTLKYLNKNQRLRSNIFIEKKDGYKLIYSYNMTADNDKDILIPKNMGVTGEVFRTGNQEISPKDKLVSNYRTPLEIIKKTPGDIEWICSTPIKNSQGNVLYTLSFDGNIDCSTQFDEIKKEAVKLADELKTVLAVR